MSLAAVVAPLQPGRMVPKAQKGKVAHLSSVSLSLFLSFSLSLFLSFSLSLFLSFSLSLFLSFFH